MSYDIRRFGTVLGMTALIGALVLFAGVPYPHMERETVSVDTTGGVAVEEADGAVLTGAAIAGAAILGGTSGYGIAKLLAQKDQVDEVTSADTSTDAEVAGYIAMDYMRQDLDDIREFTNNYQEYASAPLISDAKLKMTEMYNNGATVSEMQKAGIDTINNDAARIQMQIIEEHEAALEDNIQPLISNYNEAGVYDEFYKMPVTVGGENVYNSTQTKNDGTAFNRLLDNGSSYILANNTNVSVVGWETGVTDGTNETISWGGSGARKIVKTGIDSDEDGTNEYDEIVAYNESLLYTEAERVADKAAAFNDDIDTIAQEIANTYERGEVNTSEVTSPFERAAYYAGAWNETGSDKYANAFKKSIGKDFAENASFKVELEDGSVLEGSLFTNAFSSLDAGTKYYYGPDVNTSAVNATRYWNDTESVMFTTTEGTDYDITQNFTVSSLTNPETGESLNSTEIKQTEFETTDVSNLSVQFEYLDRLQERYDDLSGISGGSLGDLIDGDGPLGVSWIVWIIGVVLVALAVRSRD